MGRCFSMQRMRLFDEYIQFGLRELRDVHLVGGRKHATTGTNLDHIRPVLHVVADCKTGLIRRVYDALFRATLMIEDPRSKTIGVIAMTTCRSDRVQRNQHPGTRYDTCVDGIAKTHV